MLGLISRATAFLGLPRGSVGPVGASVLASLAHMTAQFCVAYGVLIGHAGLFLLLPWFLLGSWVTGLVNGLFSYAILQRMERFF